MGQNRLQFNNLWLDCLIQAVKESDPDFTHEIESAWREKMLPGIQVMKSHYDD